MQCYAGAVHPPQNPHAHSCANVPGAMQPTGGLCISSRVHSNSFASSEIDLTLTNLSFRSGFGTLRRQPVDG